MFSAKIEWNRIEVSRLWTNIKNQEFGGPIAQDHRGKHTSLHKLSIEKHNEVFEHINSSPKYQSHYGRHHTKTIYFERDLNLATWYRIYTREWGYYNIKT